MALEQDIAPFLDRRDAGRQLAARLALCPLYNPLVLALPRGGVIVGAEVARVLHAPLDVLVARKLGAPGQPELGIGAIAPGGVRVLDERAVRFLRITPQEIEAITARETLEMERRLRLYRGDRPAPPVADRTVLLVDDGLATGVTARAAILSLRAQPIRELILAVPVCAGDTAEAIHAEGTRVVCSLTPPDLQAVGYWYRNFEQVSDEEVIETLERARRANAALHESS